MNTHIIIIEVKMHRIDSSCISAEIILYCEDTSYIGKNVNLRYEVTSGSISNGDACYETASKIIKNAAKHIEGITSAVAYISNGCEVTSHINVKTKTCLEETSNIIAKIISYK